MKGINPNSPLEFDCTYSKQISNEIKIFSEDVSGVLSFQFLSEILLTHSEFTLTHHNYLCLSKINHNLGNLAFEGLVNIKVDCTAKDSVLLGYVFIS